ncbi:MAG: response regulator [Planctomycetota bacterium]|nr:response regulator [Planctomycetota bacterium]
MAIEANIKVAIFDAETELANQNYAVCDLLDRDESLSTVQKYFATSTERMRKNKIETFSFNEVYGFIDGQFIDSTGINPYIDYIPQSQPWYTISSQIAPGATAITPPYVKPVTGNVIVSLVRNLYNNREIYHGVIGINMNMSRFSEFIASLNIVEDGYCMIVNQHMQVVSHPNKRILGSMLYNLGGDYDGIYKSLMRFQEVTPTQIVDSDKSVMMVAFKKLFNGWYAGVVKPYSSFYRETRATTNALIILGLIFMLSLSFLILRLSFEKIQSDAENRSKSFFLATMSHEIRTPLNAIIGLSEIQLKKQLPPEIGGDIAKIYSSGQNLLSIINDILDISKIEAGSLELTMVDFDFPTFVNDIVQLNIVRLGSREIVFQLAIDPTIPIGWHGDELHLKQILNNLLSNAIKYTRKGKVALSINWSPLVNQLDMGMVHFSITDTGIGIKEEDMAKLFTQYQQLDAKANRHIEGTGLGLSISKELVYKMQGTIEVESEYQVGSTFTVEIPLPITDKKSIGYATAEELKLFRFKSHSHADSLKSHTPVPIPHGRVLVVDDVLTNLAVAKGLLRPYALSVECAYSGIEAVEKIRSITNGTSDTRPYDLILMDHMMPEMDGIEATRIIREELGTEYARTVPIIALTANALAGNREMFLAHGFNSYISKPINLAQLDFELKHWIKPGSDSDQAEPGNVEGITDLRGENAASYYHEFDFDRGVARFASRSIFIGILETFLTHTPGLMDKIKHPSIANLSDYIITVHGLKGSSYAIGAELLGNQAEELEFAAREGDMPTIMSTNPKFLKNMASLLEKLRLIVNSQTMD